MLLLDLEAGYCLTTLSEATRKLLESAQNAAKASGEGAAGQLKPGDCPQNAEQPVARAPRGIWRQATA